MKFQLDRLIVWPKDKTLPRSEVKFEQNTVNVITGDSRTGKSAIAGIIDYCLGSGECSIPIGVVRDNASWYGVVVHTENGRILLVRQDPGEHNTSEHSLLIPITSDNDIPDSFPDDIQTENTDDIVAQLGEMAHVPDIKRDDFGYQNERLSFRDLTHLLFQVQDIVADRYLLFYKMHITHSRDKLREWFDFILGAETVRDVLTRKQIRDIKYQLDTLQSKYDKAKDSANSLISNIRAQIIQAAGYGLCCTDGKIPEDQNELVAIARKIAAMKDSTLPKSTEESLKTVRREMRRLKIRNDQIDIELRAINRGLKEFEDMITCLSSYNEGTKKRHEHLKISEWMRINWHEVSGCTGSGTEGYQNACAELNKICNAVKDCEAAMEGTDKQALMSLKEYEILQDKAKSLTDEHANNLKQIVDLQGDAVTLKANSMNQLIGQIRQVILTADSINDADGFLKQINELKSNLAELRQGFDENAIRAKAKAATESIQNLALEKLKTLDCEEEYKQNAPIFSTNDVNILVRDSKGKRHMLSEVGSASNWVALHIAISCALQEYFAQMTSPKSFVPSFVVFDQPSQVYFPSTKKSGTEEELKEELKRLDALKLTGTDRDAVRKIFSTLADSVSAEGDGWQAIVLEHAADDVYGGIDHVTEVANWHGGAAALIPYSWYKTNEENDAAVPSPA